MYLCNAIFGISQVPAGIFAILELDKANRLAVKRSTHPHDRHQFQLLRLSCHYHSRMQELLYRWGK